MLSSSLLTLALYGVVEARANYDVQTPASVDYCPFNSICPRRDILFNSHQTTEGCSHDDGDLSNSSIALRPSAQEWTSPPICTSIPNTISEVCSFAYADFYAGRGLSLLTTPSIAASIARLLAFSASANYTTSLFSKNDTRDPPYEVTKLPGKGMGVIATRRIERGELLFAVPVVAIYLNDAVDKSSPYYHSHYSPLVQATVDALPPSTREKFDALAAHNEDGEPNIEKIYTNTFSETFDGEEHSIVVPETARINHDCRPNAMYYFDKKALIHYTHAARVIEIGEEVTDTYIDPLQTRLQRRQAIKKSWGFDCTCSLCSMSHHFVRESNRRIVKIVELNKIFEKSGRDSGAVTGTPEMAELLVSLYEQERLYSTAADGYIFAALAYSAVGKSWEAMKWAMKAVEWGLIHDGPDEIAVIDMMVMLEGVEDHWSWGINLEDGD